MGTCCLSLLDLAGDSLRTSFPSFFVTNRTGQPHGDELGRMKPFANEISSWVLSSANSCGAILYGRLEIGDVPGLRSTMNSTALSGGTTRQTPLWSSHWSRFISEPGPMPSPSRQLSRFGCTGATVPVQMGQRSGCCHKPGVVVIPKEYPHVS